MLLFLPCWPGPSACILLPSLTAVFGQHGHAVIQKDVNIEMYDLFSDTFLIWVKARMGMQLHALEGKEAAGLLTDQDADQRAALIEKAAIDVVRLGRQAWNHAAVPRSEEFYDAASWNGP